MNAYLSLTDAEIKELKRLAQDAGTGPSTIASSIVSLYLQGRLIRPASMTEAEKAQAWAMAEAGFSSSAIGEGLGRSKHAVQRALKKKKN